MPNPPRAKAWDSQNPPASNIKSCDRMYRDDCVEVSRPLHGIEVSSDVMLKLVALQPLRPKEAAEERVREGGGAIMTSDHKDTK